MVKTQIIRKLERVKDPELRDAMISLLEEVERMVGETVTKKEFLEFVEKTQENFDKVWQAINELAEAQKRTEERVNELAEAQRKTEERLNELAKAQKETEEKLAVLIDEHRKTREQVGGLAHAIGYLLEDRAYKGLPDILKKRYGIEVTEPLRRDYIKVGWNRYIEVNIIGKGSKEGKEVVIVGECKTQIKRRDVDKFLRHMKEIGDHIRGEKFMVVVAYQASPPVVEYMRKKGINFVYSYELPL